MTIVLACSEDRRTVNAWMIRSKIQSNEFKPGVPAARFDGPDPLLAAPITLLGLTVRTRIVAAIDGAPTDWHLSHLAEFAMAGAAPLFSLGHLCSECSMYLRMVCAFTVPAVPT